MGIAEDIATIGQQEAALVIQNLYKATAFAIGSAISKRGLKEKVLIVVDIRTFDRPLFSAASPGSTADNANWARRKRNVVKTFLKSTYRMVLEQQRPDRTFKVGAALDIADYVLAGGGFPVRVKGAGVIGVIAVSGLPEREDHGIVVTVIAEHLGLDAKALALPASAE